MNGKFISIEGIEGAGKSTQLAFINDYLSSKGKSLVVTREPGGTELSEEIRDLLLKPRSQGMDVNTELLMMFAARAEHVAQKIKPAIARGDWVISDRFVDATFAYQGGGRGIDVERIQQLADWTLQGLKTDLTIVFDLSVELSQERVTSRNEGKDRFEQEKATFFERIRQSYIDRSLLEPNRVKVIDASQTIEQVQQQLTTILDKLLED
jgi:dTMP kinase